MSDFYSLRVKSLDGVSDLLAPLRGSVALVVNVASQCGYTPQYAGLERLQERFRDTTSITYLRTGERVADPFRHTLDVVDLLEYRARKLRT